VRPKRCPRKCKTKLIDGLEYKFVEECLLEDRANFIKNELEKDGNSVKVVKTDLGWAVYSRPKNLKSKFLPKRGVRTRILPKILQISGMN